MKFLLAAALCFVFTIANSQERTVFFVSFSSGIPVTRMDLSIKQQMRSQGFDKKRQSLLDVFIESQEAPYRKRGFNGRLMMGKRINSFRSIYGIAGIIDRAAITGRLRSASDPRPGYVRYPEATFRYTLAQLGGGMLFTTRSKVRFGLAPSAYLFHYNLPDSSAHASVKPGISACLRMPLGKGIGQMGLEVMIELNGAPSVKTKDWAGDSHDFNPGTVPILCFSLGLALTFRELDIQML